MGAQPRRVPSAFPGSAGGRRGPYLAEGGAEHGAQLVEERVCLGRGGWSGVPATWGSQRAPEAERRGQPPFLPIPPAGRRQRRRRRRSGRRGRQRLPGPAVRLGEPAPAPPRALLSRHRPAQGPPRTGVPGRRRRARAGAGQPAARQPWLPGRAVAGNPAAPARRRRLQQRRLGLAFGDVRAHRGGARARMARRGRRGAARRGAPGGQRAGRPAGAKPEDALEAGAVPRPLKCGPVAAAHVTAQPLRPEPRASRRLAVRIWGGRRLSPESPPPAPRRPRYRRAPPLSPPRARGAPLPGGPWRRRGHCGEAPGALGKGLGEWPQRCPDLGGRSFSLTRPEVPTVTRSRRNLQKCGRGALSRGYNFGNEERGAVNWRPKEEEGTL